MQTLTPEGFRNKVNPTIFLRPLILALNDHYPAENEKRFLNFDYTPDYYWKLPTTGGSSIDLRLESHPLGYFEWKGDYLLMQFSCLKPVTTINFILHKVNQKDNHLIRVPDLDIAACEILQETVPYDPNRTRFVLRFALPEREIYDIRIFVNQEQVHHVWVKMEGTPVTFVNFYSI